MTAPTYAELEAQAAAMRKALQEALEHLDDGDGDSVAIIETALTLDAGRQLLERLARAEAALKRIAEHPHCAYEREGAFNRLPVDRQYEIGIADGHRCAASEARAALAPAPKEGA